MIFKQLLDTEDLAESENKELASRLESLESIVRMLELKHKNSLEHASRLEEREGDLKKVSKKSELFCKEKKSNETFLTGIFQTSRSIHRALQNACRLHGANKIIDGFNAFSIEFKQF